MGYFRGDNRDNRSGGSRSFGGNRSFGAKRSFGGNRGGDRQMYDAVCDNCGKPCQLPFKPTGDKPVYCRDCFAKMGGGDRPRNDAPRQSFQRSDAPREASPSRAEFEALNAKLDKILALLTPQAPKAQEVVKEVAAVEEPATVEEVVTEQAPVVEKKKRVSKKATTPAA